MPNQHKMKQLNLLAIKARGNPSFLFIKDIFLLSGDTIILITSLPRFSLKLPEAQR